MKFFFCREDTRTPFVATRFVLLELVTPPALASKPLLAIATVFVVFEIELALAEAPASIFSVVTIVILRIYGNGCSISCIAGTKLNYGVLQYARKLWRRHGSRSTPDRGTKF
jgi:hypothetical protein